MDMASGFPDPVEVPGNAADPGMASIARDIRFALGAMGVLLLALLAGALIVPVDGAVIASGSLGVESRVKRVTHPTGGVIAEIFVRNGAHVKAGDPLIRLDDRVIGEQSSLATLSVHQLLAQRARLEAERLGSGSIQFPAELAGSRDAGAQQAMADEQRLFAVRQSEHRALRAQLQARGSQYRRQIGGLQAQILALRQQQTLIEPELQGVRKLWDRGLVTITRKNELERTAVALQGQIASHEADIAQVQARIGEAEEQAIQLGQTRRAEAGVQLAQVNAALNDQRMRRVAASDSHDRSIIRATYAGTVDNLAYAAIGDVVRAAEFILDIVPDRDQLIVEATVSPTDIERVQVNQLARIRFSGLNSSVSPELKGKVVLVAADRSVDPQTRQSYFPVRVEILPDSLADQPELKLRAGMPAEVFVETGRRTLLSYVTKPFQDQFARAFRDE